MPPTCRVLLHRSYGPDRSKPVSPNPFRAGADMHVASETILFQFNSPFPGSPKAPIKSRFRCQILSALNVKCLYNYETYYHDLKLLTNFKNFQTPPQHPPCDPPTALPSRAALALSDASTLTLGREALGSPPHHLNSLIHLAAQQRLRFTAIIQC